MKTITLDDDDLYFIECELYIRSKELRRRAACFAGEPRTDADKRMCADAAKEAERCERIHNEILIERYGNSVDADDLIAAFIPPPSDNDRRLDDEPTFDVSYIASGPRGREIERRYQAWM